MGWATRFLAAVCFFAAGVLFVPEALLGSPPPALAPSPPPSWPTNLPRHMFGNLQSKMFPAYFTLISACAAISVAAFAYLHPWKTASTVERYQLGFLLSALGCNLSNLLVFTPMTIEMMKKRHKIERDLSIGEEVGWSKNQQVAKSNPTLAAMNKKFGMIHGLSSLANIMSFGSLAMHSWYLASKLEL
ncbi:unnamed protein product [Miscanthus lutarioriparius]|uniref:TMEM205-like domain-containing protein n=1 Tax=Miscanthus lutarioriparius TaxID=422564 RepID=A0A811RIM8_9POAL|nr:unnamed protein product [Miscanthus lutarioriparius]